jgi:hypothetical protein
MAQQHAAGVITDRGKGTDTKKEPACETCGGVVDARVVKYCHAHGERFAGKTLCRSCQRAPNTAVTSHTISIKHGEAAVSTANPPGQKGACANCGAAVDGKVVFFCRMNKEKFEGKILYRECQKVPQTVT